MLAYKVVCFGHTRIYNRRICYTTLADGLKPLSMILTFCISEAVYINLIFGTLISSYTEKPLQYLQCLLVAYDKQSSSQFY